MGSLHTHDTNTLRPSVKASDCQVETPINIKKVHEYVHEIIPHLSTKLMALMFVTLESYPKGNFNNF